MTLLKGTKQAVRPSKICRVIKERIGHWGHVVRAGFGVAYAVIGFMTLVVGGSVLLAVHWGREHVAWGIAAIAGAIVIVLLEGSYREKKRLDKAHAEKTSNLLSEHQAAVAKIQAKLAIEARERKITFQDIRNGGKTNRTTFNNTYNEAAEPVAGEGGLIGISVDGGRIDRSEAYVRFGPPLPFPTPRASNPQERASLRQQLLEIASRVEVIFSEWIADRQVIARKIGIPESEFMARMDEILLERERITEMVTARYNRECRSDVMAAYSHARDIGYADREMETLCKTEIAAGAQAIPARLKTIASRIQGLQSFQFPPWL